MTLFRKYLGERFTAGELKRRFGITDLAAHQFDEIVAWHEPSQSTPLRREMLRFSQIASKRAFDEVFLGFGRSLKPDLIDAQWNHLGEFSQISGDERCLLPGELWGRGEDYLWYSMGGPLATARVSASRPALENEITIHWVNYNREEPADKRIAVNGIKHEKPIAAPSCEVDFKLPASFSSPRPAAAGPRSPRRTERARGEARVRRVEFLTPEAEQAPDLEFEQVGSILRFRVPEFLADGVVVSAAVSTSPFRPRREAIVGTERVELG